MLNKEGPWRIIRNSFTFVSHRPCQFVYFVFIYLLIRSVSKYLLNGYCVLSDILGPGDSEENR